MSGNKKTVITLLILIMLMAAAPLLMLKDAEFGGADDAAGGVVEEITGEAYEPWFTPVAESLIGGEIPGEIESLFFCIQTGIGAGGIAFLMGRFVERKKWMDKEAKEGR